MTWTTSQKLLAGSLTNGAGSTFSLSAVGERTGSTSSFADLTGENSGTYQIGFNNSTNTAFLYAGTVATKASVNDNSFHAMQGLFKSPGTSDILYVDGSSSTVNAGNPGSTWDGYQIIAAEDTGPAAGLGARLATSER